MDAINIGVLTVSDRCAREEAIDESGPALVVMLGEGIIKNANVLKTHLVPDSKKDIEEVLKQWCDVDNLDLVLTTGGTGLSQRDVTPEATEAVLERTAPAIPHLIFKHSSAVTPLAALSRGVAGLRGKSLIINLPGSKKAARECLEAVASVIPHAVDVIRDRKGEVEGVHTGLKKKSSVTADCAAFRSRESPYPCISVSIAQEVIIEEVTLMRKEVTVGYEDALYYVLAETVLARDDLPPYDASLKDGYAVKSSDSKTRKVLVGVLHAGDSECNLEVVPGCCVRVSTGGPIPPGADAVVPVEYTSLGSENGDLKEEREIIFNRSFSCSHEIRKKGSDFSQGEMLMKCGTYLNAAGVGLLAAAGITLIKVYRKPVVAVMSTGNELSSPEKPFEPRKIRDSNRITLISTLKEENYKTVDLGIIPDEPDLLRDALEKGFRAADVVVTSGSMSMGERDFLKKVFVDDFGGRICFGRVYLRPGMPTAFGIVDFEGVRKAWFGLPGNPSSTVVSSHLFLLPGLRKISGLDNVLPTKIYSLVPGYTAQIDRPQYLRGIVDLLKPKESNLIELAKNQSSSCIRSCVDANCLFIIPSSKERQLKCNNNEVEVLLLGKAISRY